jgi:Bacterial CdiA-CT RNAse A domain
VPTASTFHTLQGAERAVAQALRANRATITAWAKSARVGDRTRIVFDAGQVVGSGVTRSSNAVIRMTRVRVVLKKVATPDRVYFVLTAFPIP